MILKGRHSRELFSGSVVVLILKTLGFGLGYVFMFLIIRELGAKSWGMFTLGLTILNIAVILGRLGIDTALLQILSQYNQRADQHLIRSAYRTGWIATLAASSLLATALYLAADLIAATIFRKPELGETFRLASLAVVPMVLLSLNSECMRGMKWLKSYAFFFSIARFLFAVLFFIAIFTLDLWSGDPGLIPIVSYTLAATTACLISFLIARSMLSALPKKISSNDIGTREMLKKAFPMMLVSSSVFLMGWVDIIVLGIFETEDQVGIYNVALRLAMIVSFTLTAINAIAAPKFSDSFHNEGVDEFRKVVRLSSTFLFWSSFPVLLVLIVFAEPALSFFGEECIQGWVPLIMLALAQFSHAFFGSVGYIMQMTGKQRVFQRIMLGGVALNTLLNFMLIPEYGISGAAAASLASMILWKATACWYIYRHYGVLTVYLPFRPGVR